MNQAAWFPKYYHRDENVGSDVARIICLDDCIVNVPVLDLLDIGLQSGIVPSLRGLSSGMALILLESMSDVTVVDE